MREYKKLTPFKLCVLQNFPFIEEDFDALTNYELMCKIVEYLNKTIDSQNMVVANITELNNWFNNLDVQDEINNKLDVMAESGQLAEIIGQYINLHGVLAFNTLNELKNATNIVDGSICRTLGDSTYNDGKGAYFKIRTITSSDVVDNIKIFALTVSNTLIAEKMSDYNINTLNNRIDIVDSNVLTELVVVGDSYTAFANSNWAELVAEQLHLNLHKHATSSMGYVTDVGGQTFINNLSWGESQEIKNKTKYVICYGGINDRTQNKDTLKQKVKDFCTSAKNMYPNAQIIIVGPQSSATSSSDSTYNYLINAIREGALESSVSYADAHNWLISNGYGYTETYASDNLHPSELGYKIIASKMLSLIAGNDDNYPFIKLNIIADYSSNSIVKSSVDKNKEHVFVRINSISLASGVFVKIAEISNLLSPFVNIQEPLIVYSYNTQYNFISGVIGNATFNNNGELRIVNTSGNAYNGAVIVSGDIYFNEINQ